MKLRLTAQVTLLAWTIFMLGDAIASAQISSSISGNFSPTLSDPLAPSSGADGFNTSFDASTSNLTNTFLRTDISDPTHAMLDGSFISPVDNANVNGFVSTQPLTQVLTDAQMAVAFGSESFGGRQSRAFAAGANSFAETGSSSATSGNSARGGFTRGAFSGSLTGRAAFSSQSASSNISGQAFSGDVSSAPVDPTYSTAQSIASVSLADGTRARLSVDPVFANAGSGMDSSMATQGDPIQPSAEAGEFFASDTGAQPQYQFDDGETPLLGGPLVAGRIIDTSTAYGVGAGGFSDSTKGMAGVPLEGSGSVSPFPSLTLSGDSPFRSFSDGSVYEPKEYLNPSLSAPPTKTGNASALARARRAEQKRIEMGMSTTESEEIYQQEVKNARNPSRRSTLHDSVRDSFPGAANATH